MVICGSEIKVWWIVYAKHPITGELAKEGDKNTKIFYFLKGTEPSYGTKDFETVFKEEIWL